MSSRNNRRLSMGGVGGYGISGGGYGSGSYSNAAPQALFRDSSNSSTTARAKNRRMSLGGGAVRHETPQKDRHAMLEEYRMQQQQQQNQQYQQQQQVVVQQKRALEPEQQQQMTSSFDFRGSTVGLPRSSSHYNPPTSAPVRTMTAATAAAAPPMVVPEGSNALERFRMRKQQKLHQQHTIDDNSLTFNNATQNNSYYDANELSSYEEPTVSFNTFGSAAVATSAPSATPRRPVAANNSNIVQSVVVAQLHRQGQVPPRPNSFAQEPSLSQETDAGLSQLSQDSCVGTVESAARYENLQKRLRQVEEEKMSIAMAMAPMEARHRQKEDAWIKEQNRLLQEIEGWKQQSQATDERCRDVEAQKEAADEELRQLRMQVKKESRNLHNDNMNGTSSNWSRHLQLDRDVSELREKLAAAEAEVQSGRLDKVSVEKELYSTKIEREAAIRALEEIQDEYEIISKAKSDEREAQIKFDALTTEHTATSARLNAICSDFAASKAAFQASLEAKDIELEQCQFEMSVLKTRAATASSNVDRLNASTTDSDVEDFAVLKARIEERDRKIAEFEKERLSWETLRRQMHNRIQELRGNIRVFVRTRPFLPNDGGESESAIDVSPDGESLSIMDARTASPYAFTFDKVFPPSAGQDQVFDEVADFVQSALDGYHVCLFSYGQTGSGKTHTMQGSGNGAMRGIIPRAVEQILVQCHEMRSQKWKYSLSASFLEIYNEDLKDLLVDMSGAGGSSSSSSQFNSAKLAIKRNRDGKSYVEGLTEVSIDSNDSVTGMEQLEALMKVAARSRSVASTKMNAQSSRSHSVFMLHLRGYNEESGTEVHGALNLCDLAGSERLDRSGANADAKRLRETQAINKSLSCLGDVFNALAQKSSHVPYRNSKLTYLLQDCLSGDGKALMFVNLSPTNQSSNESLCSLRFAQRVNQVELGKATKHIQYNR